MLLKLSAILFLIKISCGLEESHEWDLAVATDGQIELLSANGSTIGKVREGFTKLKALSFDNIRHTFIVSDMDEDFNDTIFALDLTKETENIPIITDLPDDVQGLAIDPIEDILYWTDSINHTINYLSLKEKEPQSKILFMFDEAKPQDITIDVCKRYIYWTNSLIKRPTIERAKIGSEIKEIIVEDDLGMPAGITIDHRSQRIYWADIRGGIYYRIESTNLLGEDREVVYEGTHAQPFAVAIKEGHLYFTDLGSNALWKLDLTRKSQPYEIRVFDEKPMGLIAKKQQIKSLPDCMVLEEAYKNFSKPTVEIFEDYKEKDMSKPIECINGTLENGQCRCDRGFSGVFCEISLCHNFCFIGSCHLTHQGYPYCRCPRDFGGRRCEKTCDGYCMNGGECRFSSPNARLPSCTCPEGFKGPRCEQSVITERLCDLYCSGESDDQRIDEREQKYCKCSNRNYMGVVAKHSSNAKSPDSLNYVDYFHDSVFITLGCVTLFALLICAILTITILYIRRRPTPKIRKRFIVHKNPSTSLTERPQHPDQCEITIENCCNMNVCETPCFEPLQGYCQSRNDDKKMLLPNMERTEDLY